MWCVCITDYERCMGLTDSLLRCIAYRRYYLLHLDAVTGLALHEVENAVLVVLVFILY